MATITLELPDSTPLATLKELAESVGCDLRLVQQNSFKAVPKDSAGQVVRFPAQLRSIDGGAA